MDQCFGKQLRIRSGRDFTAAIHGGSCAADGILVLFAKPSDRPDAVRLGVTVPKRTGSAVLRNRWKRHIREAFRTQRHRFPLGYDFVVRPKKGASPDGPAIAASLPHLARIATDRQRNRQRR